MKEKYSVSLSLGSLVYLSGLIGLCSGFTYGVIYSVYMLFEGSSAWYEILIVPPGAAIFNAFTLVVSGILAFPLYKKITAKGPANQLSGHFQPLPSEVNDAL